MKKTTRILATAVLAGLVGLLYAAVAFADPLPCFEPANADQVMVPIDHESAPELVAADDAQACLPAPEQERIANLTSRPDPHGRTDRLRSEPEPIEPGHDPPSPYERRAWLPPWPDPVPIRTAAARG